MNKFYFLYILLTAGILSACNPMGEIKPKVEQIVTEFMDEPHIATSVWHKGEVVWIKFDNLETMTDSLVIERHNQAEKVVAAINACR